MFGMAVRSILRNYIEPNTLAFGGTGQMRGKTVSTWAEIHNSMQYHLLWNKIRYIIISFGGAVGWFMTVY